MAAAERKTEVRSEQIECIRENSHPQYKRQKKKNQDEVFSLMGWELEEEKDE